MAKIGIHQIREVAKELLASSPQGLSKQELITQISLLHLGTDVGTISTQVSKLAELGMVERPRHGFYVLKSPNIQSPSGAEAELQAETSAPEPAPPLFSASQFEHLAREVMSRHYGKPLRSAVKGMLIKQFDCVSDDGKIVGDAKFFSLVAGSRLPSAKFSIIAEHVWLLEKTAAQRRFLTFGNQREVAVQWLSRYGRLVSNVEFYYLELDGRLDRLNSIS